MKLRDCICIMPLRFFYVYYSFPVRFFILGECEESVREEERQGLGGRRKRRERTRRQGREEMVREG